MKKILKAKRKYTYLDFFWLLAALLGHIATWGAFITLLYLANHLKSGYDLQMIFDRKRALSFYICIAGPVVSYVCYSIKFEWGYMAAKIVSLVHSTIVIVYGFISFVFF